LRVRQPYVRSDAPERLITWEKETEADRTELLKL